MKNVILIVGVVLILFVLVGSVVLQLSAAVPQTRMGQRVAWKAPITGGEVEVLKTMDFTGDGQDEVFAQTPGQVLLLSSEGQTLFSQSLFGAKSTMGDLDGNGVEDFAIAQPEAAGLKVTAYTGSGGQMWERLVPDVGAPTRGLTLDFEGDGMREVILGTDTGMLVCLEGKTGDLRWSYTFPPTNAEDLYVRGTDDVLSDGNTYLAAGVYGGHVVVLDGAGSPISEMDFPQQLRRLRAFDMNGDGGSEFLLGGVNGLVRLVAAAGNTSLWESSIGSRVNEARFLELDGDPTQTEVVVGGKNGGVSAYNLAGAVLWRRTVSGKVREFATLDSDQDGQNELLVAADRTYLLEGRTGKLLSSFSTGSPTDLDVGDIGAERGYLVGAGGSVSAFIVSHNAQPWWLSPITGGLALSLLLASLTVILTRFDWEKKEVYTVQDQSLEALRARKRMLREVLDDTERVYSEGQISAQVYLEKSRLERERLAAVEEQILKLNPTYKPEVIRCPACAGPVEIALDQCPYCKHVLL